MKILKANRILNTNQSRTTLREWIVTNYKDVEDKNILVSCLEEYEPGEDAVIGVLFDGKITDLLNSPNELTTDDYNYLTQEDLDRCTVKEVESFGDGKGIEIIVENYL